MKNKKILKAFLRHYDPGNVISESRFLKMLKDKFPGVELEKLVVLEDEKVDSLSKYLLEVNKFRFLRIVERSKKYGKKS